MANHQQRDGAGTEPGQRLVCATRQNDRNARTKDDACDLCLREIFELLGQHVTGLKIGHDENIRTTGDWRDDALRLGCFRRHCIIEGERPVENAACDLAAVSHLAERRRVKGGPDAFRYRLNGRENGHSRFQDAQRVYQVDCVLNDVALLLQRRVDVDRGIREKIGLG